VSDPTGLDARVRVRLDRLDLDVAVAVGPGEVVAVVGPNGAGKSTVLAALAGLVPLAGGRVVLDGAVLEDHATGTFVPPERRSVGLGFQDLLLFPHLTAVDNVAFGLRHRGHGRADARRLALEELDRLGAAALASARPATLSGGQAARVALARALAPDPRLVLLDEPLAALDVDVAPALRRTLQQVLADRTTVLVTHDVLDALLLADRVVVLECGAVVEEGPTQEVLTRPRSAFAARFAGLNLVRVTWRDGAVQDEHGRRVVGEVDGPAPPTGGRAVAVFRPAAVSVFRTSPGGSPRTTLPVTVTAVEPSGDRLRVRADGLQAEITPTAAAELDLLPGDRVHFAVKATEVAVYAR
jgi:molybdate transport system ATP-binding protein